MDDFTAPGQIFTPVSRDDIVRYVRRQLAIDPQRSRASMIGSAMWASRYRANPLIIGDVYDQETRNRQITR